MAQRGYGQQQQACVLEETWITVAGKLFAARSRAVHLRRGVLEVIVRDSSTLQELTFQKSCILRALTKEMSSERIGDLKFRIGHIE